eukprot:m.220817 g.220817  ORF g.220817 m.220817 type:complete len:645 (+) comp15654_c0_seq1:853-2787(+)
MAAKFWLLLCLLLGVSAQSQSSPPTLSTQNGSFVLTIRRGANVTVRWVDETGVEVQTERLIGATALNEATAQLQTTNSLALSRLQANMSASVATLVSATTATLLQTMDTRVSSALANALGAGPTALVTANTLQASLSSAQQNQSTSLSAALATLVTTGTLQTSLLSAQQNQTASLSSALTTLVTPAMLATSVSTALVHARNYSDTAVAGAIAGDGLESALITQSYLTASMNSFSTSVQTALLTKVDTRNLAVIDSRVTSVVTNMLAIDATPNALQTALATKLTNTSTCGCVNPNAFSSLQTSLQSLVNISNVTLGCHARGLLLDPQTGLCQSSQLPNCGTNPPLPLGGAANCVGDTFFRATCPAACQVGYIQTGLPFYTCNAQGVWVGNLTCTPMPCSQPHPALSSGIVAAGGCVNTVSGSACNLSCATNYQAVGNMTVTCRLGQYSALQGSCRSMVDCHGWPDGVQSIRINGGASALSVRCSSNWTIIDYNRDATWTTFLRGGQLLSVPGGSIYAPTLANLQAQTASRWNSWFLIATSSNSQFAVSDDCATCRNAGYAIYSTGTYIGCYFYNRNCDMPASQVCSTCASNYQSMVTTGLCSHLEYTPDSTYPWDNCGGNWWHSHPALGANGKFCVCYRPLAAIV